MNIVMTDTKEADLAQAIGVDRKEIISFRKTKLSPELWYRENTGGRPTKFGIVWLKPDGVKAIYDHYGLKEAEQPTPEKISAANAAYEVTVIRADFPNRRIVQVHLADGKAKMMRVKDSRMWVQGMKVMARPEGALDVTLVPVRHPRFRGRF